MSLSILEVLQGAGYNLKTARRFWGSDTGSLMLDLAMEQVANAVGLLVKGYGVYTEIEPLLEKHGNVEAVPESPDIRP